MKTNLIVVCSLIMHNLSVFANTSAEGNAPVNVGFEQGGKPTVKIFSNFNTSLDGKDAAFEINRAYFGYAYDLSAFFSMDVLLDIGKPTVEIPTGEKLTSNYHYVAFLKKASLNYSSGKMEVALGMIGLKNFKLQENYWGHRYVEKSFQDLNKLTPSADLGLSISYDLNEFLSFDYTIRNGEGYKLQQVDNSFSNGLGLTVKPASQLVLRAYYDASKKEVLRSVISGFVGLKLEKLTAGAEYNRVSNEGYATQKQLNGVSAYASYSINKTFQVFSRFDLLSSNSINGNDAWNANKDGEYMIGGIEMSPTKGVKTALNVQYPFTSNSAALYLNFEYNF